MMLYKGYKLRAHTNRLLSGNWESFTWIPGSWGVNLNTEEKTLLLAKVRASQTLLWTSVTWSSLWKADSDSVGRGWSLKFHVSNKVPQDDDAAGPWTTLWVATAWGLLKWGGKLQLLCIPRWCERTIGLGEKLTLLAFGQYVWDWSWAK